MWACVYDAEVAWDVQVDVDTDVDSHNVDLSASTCDLQHSALVFDSHDGGKWGQVRRLAKAALTQSQVKAARKIPSDLPTVRVRRGGQKQWESKYQNKFLRQAISIYY